MSPGKHLTSGILLGTVVYRLTEDKSMALSAGVSSVVCDVDHALEYAQYCVKFRKRPCYRDFISGDYFDKKRTICVLLHGWEYLFITIVASCFTKKSILKGVTMGYGLHLLLDTIGNDCTILGYSFIYRLLSRFDIDKICVKSKKR